MTKFDETNQCNNLSADHYCLPKGEKSGRQLEDSLRMGNDNGHDEVICPGDRDVSSINKDGDPDETKDGNTDDKGEASSITKEEISTLTKDKSNNVAPGKELQKISLSPGMSTKCRLSQMLKLPLQKISTSTNAFDNLNPRLPSPISSVTIHNPESPILSTSSPLSQSSSPDERTHFSEERKGVTSSKKKQSMTRRFSLSPMNPRKKISQLLSVVPMRKKSTSFCSVEALQPKHSRFSSYSPPTFPGRSSPTHPCPSYASSESEESKDLCSDLCIKDLAKPRRRRRTRNKKQSKSVMMELDGFSVNSIDAKVRGFEMFYIHG